ncbi:MAG: hypothetical protein DPW09_37995 [Anaerolineae bacterium]|nr:hypothetical protein [Anaerolineae bacterium]MCQ3979249.1 hypothetical protein [Anaerolineae bacterium]
MELASELVSKDFIMDFAGFIATVRKGMQLADNAFNLRRKIVEILDVTVILTVENGEPVFYPKCVLKVADRPLLYNDLRTGLQQWQYEPGRKCTRNLILQTRILYKPL